MSRDPRDWQADMDMCNKATDGLDTEAGSLQVYTEYSNDPELKDTLIGRFLKEEDAIFMVEARTGLPYWLQQAKTLKEDNAHWICKHTAAEQKYQTQSNVIAELRGRAEKAEERERKLKEELEGALRFISRTDHNDPTSVANFIRSHFELALSTLYPLDMEDTTNES